MLSRAARFLTNRRLERRWDYFIWSAGAAGLVAIPLVQAVPGSVPLVWLALLGLPANGPLSPIMPTAFEPLIMEAARHQHVVAVALAALGTALYAEVLNWHLYRWTLSWDRFTTFRDRPWVRRAVAYFARQRFVTVVVFAFTPLPFWIVRCLAILEGYQLSRFLVATAVGRLPRYLFYAWAGALLKLPSVLLAAVALGTAVVLVAWRLGRGQRVLADTVLDPQLARDVRVPARAERSAS